MANAASEIRQPAVAGTFYPADAGELRRMVEGYLKVKAGAGAAGGRTPPKALIAPPMKSG